MSDILYVYGTLRPGGPNVVEVPGEMFDLGRFPGVFLTGGPGKIVCEKIEVDNLDDIDRYEGYYPEDHAGSLYIRRSFNDGFIYEFNRAVDPGRRVETGDWLKHKKEERGSHGRGFGKGS